MGRHITGTAAQPKPKLWSEEPISDSVAFHLSLRCKFVRSTWTNKKARSFIGLELPRAIIEFIDLVINQRTEHGVMEPARLYESPFTDICPTRPDGIFTSVQLDALIGIIEGGTSAAGAG